ncbi:hypothetical protein QBC35DRAFT_477879 [Podospora australis]|uniref:Zn(2)-C6 fungal-type domain-containing protein n=1 Tax=Podospora australis TaxID=1536484 RepID=A0AAN6WLZ7_9PEZI|nr:hypothetical protein QBC35DRAFT_477879 [Podospora australis]
MAKLNQQPALDVAPLDQSSSLLLSIIIPVTNRRCVFFSLFSALFPITTSIRSFSRSSMSSPVNKDSSHVDDAGTAEASNGHQADPGIAAVGNPDWDNDDRELARVLLARIAAADLAAGSGLPRPALDGLGGVFGPNDNVEMGDVGSVAQGVPDGSGQLVEGGPSSVVPSGARVAAGTNEVAFVDGPVGGNSVGPASFVAGNPAGSGMSGPGFGMSLASSSGDGLAPSHFTNFSSYNEETMSSPPAAAEVAPAPALAVDDDEDEFNPARPSSPSSWQGSSALHAFMRASLPTRLNPVTGAREPNPSRTSVSRFQSHWTKNWETVPSHAFLRSVAITMGGEAAAGVGPVAGSWVPALSPSRPPAASGSPVAVPSAPGSSGSTTARSSVLGASAASPLAATPSSGPSVAGPAVPGFSPMRVSCRACRASRKLRCEGGSPCRACTEAGRVCEYPVGGAGHQACDNCRRNLFRCRRPVLGSCSNCDNLGVPCTFS